MPQLSKNGSNHSKHYNPRQSPDLLNSNNSVFGPIITTISPLFKNGGNVFYLNGTLPFIVINNTNPHGLSNDAGGTIKSKGIILLANLTLLSLFKQIGEDIMRFKFLMKRENVKNNFII